MLPAFQPGIDALGPLFPVFESGLDQRRRCSTLGTPVAQQLGRAGFGALAPLYGPYREDVLAGEAQLAAFLRPLVASWPRPRAANAWSPSRACSLAGARAH